LIKKEILVRLVQDYEGPNLLRQTPGQTGIWDGIRFTLEPLEECDFLIVLRSQMKNPISVRCPPQNVWAVVQDPYVPGFNDWLVEGYDKFSRVFTPEIPYFNGKFIRSQPALPWYVNRGYDELVSLPVPEKTKDLSWILGNQRDIPGHFKRRAFLAYLKREGKVTFDLFGRIGQPLTDKAEALLPYRYSLAVENSCTADYWTEKIADCFLCWTVPIYYGCSNLEDYFPADSFIRIDIEKPKEAQELILTIIKNDDWARRLNALREARYLILNKYQLFPHFSSYIRKELPVAVEREYIHIPVYKRSKRAKCRRVIYKAKRAFWRFTYP